MLPAPAANLPDDAPPPDSLWRHYKGGLYRVLHVARHSETEEWLVIYVAEGKPEVWVRPLAMWRDRIEEHERFAPADNQDPPLRVLVCGARNWTDKDAIERELRTLPPGSVIISAGSRGADQVAVRIAWNLRLRVEQYTFEPGRSPASQMRRMFEKGHPQTVWVFHADLEHSEGTAVLVRRAQEARVPIRVISR